MNRIVLNAHTGAVFIMRVHPSAQPIATLGRGHIPALDGVRGLAIMLVIAQHLSLLAMGHRATDPFPDRIVHALAAIGWTGVDLFFVLSGFLITGILVDNKGRPAALGWFWRRRALRIFPLYYAACAVLFFILPRTPYFESDPAVATLRSNAAWYWTYSVNVMEVVRGQGSAAFNTGHFWSLAVEEQFYLVWPLVVLGVSRRKLWWIVLGMAVGALLVRIACLLWLSNGTLAAYILAPARMDSLAAGAALALLTRTPEGFARLAPRLPAVALAALLVLVGLAYSNPYSFSTRNAEMATLGYTALAVLYAAGMGSVLAAPATAGWTRPFRGRLLRRCGKYSYCLYVVHYPLMVLLNLAIPHFHIPHPGGSALAEWAAYAALLISASFTCAWVSWQILEGPILARKDRRASAT